MREVRERVGGVQGCTTTDLLVQVGNTYTQAIWPTLIACQFAAESADPREWTDRRAVGFVGGCAAWRQGGNTPGAITSGAGGGALASKARRGQRHGDATPAARGSDLQVDELPGLDGERRPATAVKARGTGRRRDSPARTPAAAGADTDGALEAADCLAHASRPRRIRPAPHGPCRAPKPPPAGFRARARLPGLGSARRRAPVSASAARARRLGRERRFFPRRCPLRRACRETARRARNAGGQPRPWMDMMVGPQCAASRRPTWWRSTRRRPCATLLVGAQHAWLYAGPARRLARAGLDARRRCWRRPATWPRQGALRRVVAAHVAIGGGGAWACR